MTSQQPQDSFYYEGDNGIGVILYHAYTGSPYDVNLVGRFLNRQGFSVLIPKFTGHGSLDLDALLEATPRQWWSDTVESIEWMQAKNLDKLFVFGLSMGGIMATAALATPELGLSGGGTFNSPVAPVREPNLDVPFSQYVRYIAKKSDQVQEVAQAMDEIMDRHHQQIRALFDFGQAYANRLGVINQPFFIAQSGRDEMVSRSTGEELRQALDKASVTYIYLPENTHVVSTNSNRDTFEGALLGFLKQYS